MSIFLNYPRLLLIVSFVVLWLAAQLGAKLRGRGEAIAEEDRQDLSVVTAASLTLLGLIIGFTFSMASGRYDQRKNLEEAEANAIGTAYLRAELLPVADATRVRELLRNYLDQRIAVYQTRDTEQLQTINAATAQIQNQLWSAARTAALAQPNALTSLVIAGTNDVINSQGYTQAALWNRIPRPAWWLMITIAICCNVLIGYGARRTGLRAFLLFVLPLVVAIAFFLIADIDSPRGGTIRVQPQNLLSLAESLRTH